MAKEDRRTCVASSLLTDGGGQIVATGQRPIEIGHDGAFALVAEAIAQDDAMGRGTSHLRLRRSALVPLFKAIHRQIQ